MSPKLVAHISAALALFAISAPSHAYLDPGTGSIILQSLLAGIAVAMGVLRLYWHRLKTFISGLSETPTEPEGGSTEEFSTDTDAQE